jgi:hypothetical protein
VVEKFGKAKFVILRALPKDLAWNEEARSFAEYGSG